MKECRVCGVVFEKETNVCPLCGADEARQSDEEAVAGNQPVEAYLRHRREFGKYLWELAGIIGFSAILACTSVDILTGNGLGWSYFADISIITAWIILTLILRTPDNPYFSFAVLVITVTGSLLLFDLATEGKGWFFPVALPVSLSAIFIFIALNLMWNRAKIRGFDFLASVLGGSSLLCIVTEICVDHFMSGILSIGWSLIVTVSILPVIMILLFMHYRMRRGRRLGSFFHV